MTAHENAGADDSPPDGTPPPDGAYVSPHVLDAMQGRGPIAKYNFFFTGGRGLLAVLRYELVVSLLQQLPGAPGYALRGLLYRRLLGRGGRGLTWGLQVGLRHPGKMALGDNTAIDDFVLLCARGAPAEDAPSFSIGDDSVVGRFSVIQSKRGALHIGRRAAIGTHCQIQTHIGCTIGDHFMAGPQCYLGGARHGIARSGVPMLDQPTDTRGPMWIGNDVWLGAGVRILDGLRLGHGAVVGAGSVVTRNVPDYGVVAGVPARLVGYRGLDGEVVPDPPTDQAGGEATGPPRG